MTILMKKASLIIGLTIGLVSFYLYFESINKIGIRPSTHGHQMEAKNVRLSGDKQHGENIESKLLENREYNDYKAKMIQQLLSRYGDKIDDIRVQASLKDFHDYVLDTFPYFGEVLFKEIIQTSFPDHAKSIFSVLARISEYDQWEMENISSLNAMSVLQREGEIWQKRYALFGDDANKIWYKEIASQQSRQAAMHQSIEELNKAYDTTMDERLYLLQNSIKEQYSGSIEELAINKELVSGVFFGFDAVQKELESMNPEERQRKINTIRHQLGYTEEQITKMAKRDDIRNQRWQTGFQYMKEKAELEGIYDDKQLESKLNALRIQYFKKEAYTIALEEKDGFFRFERPRLYGRN